MPLYVFQCPNGHVQERRFSFHKCKKQLKCACGRHATKQVTYPKYVFYRGPGFTSGGYDYMEEAATGRDFEFERKRKEYFDKRDALDEQLDNTGLNIYEDKLQFTRTSPQPDAV